ncbi:hypothetical protein TCAL_03376 [Tigriopus californicus]|uniref:Uncharacterized protein n=1 Tax=Tigriopus californicus TaxID=6832 RepID=A0A553P1K2_TIGCA|nr:uncharacterized protein LOC131883160 [Tigriopus californicus]TRY71569.1 hypothetical protein TCAL_03376 [Tigriopus californicus]|eukprot:TCALIF_03376-PA protein Name:"Protein of unknown function" AED:0.00 eAED:0.00 QI:492/1/1/1/0/0.5/2/238/154
MCHTQILIGLAFLLVTYASSASLTPHEEHVVLNHQPAEHLKRSLGDRLNTHELIFRKRSLLDDSFQTISGGSGPDRSLSLRSPANSHVHSIAQRSTYLNGLDTVRSLTKRSAEPAAPYRGHSFQRNSSIRRRPIRTRSRFYRTRENPNRVSPSG